MAQCVEHPDSRFVLIEGRREFAPDLVCSRRTTHVSLFGLPVHRSRVGTRTATIGVSLAAVATLTLGAHPIAAAPLAPKAYVGLFGDNSIAVIDTATNEVTKTIPIPAGPHGLVITPDGKWVYASSDGDSVVSLISTATDEVTTSIDVGATPHGLAITPDGSRVLVAGFGTDQVEAIDTSTNQVAWHVKVPQPHNLAITADGLTAYAGSQKAGSEALAVIDIPTGSETGSVPLDHTPRALNLSPDGQEVFFTEAGVDALLVLDRASNQIVAQIPTGASPHHPLFTPDGTRGMVVAQGPGELDLFDPGAYTSTGTVKLGDMPHWIAATSDNHFAFVTNEKSNDVSMVDLTTSTVAATIPVGNAPRKIVLQPGAVQLSGGALGPHSTQPTPAPQLPAPVAVAQQGQAAAVSIARFAFVPATITISAGQSITWTNSDPVDHTATSDDAIWDSGALGPNATFSSAFPQPGTYAYHCTIHPFIRGTVVVQ